VLEGAQLQGAVLSSAGLQGASLGGAGLQGASLGKVFAWRADAREAAWEDTRVITPEAGPMSVASYEKLKQLIAEQVPEGDKRRDAMKRIEQRLDPAKALEGEDEMANVWEHHARSSPGLDVYEKRLAEIWRKTGCAVEGMPYVLGGLLGQLEVGPSPFAAQSPQLSALAAAFLDGEHCAGTADNLKATLKAIRGDSSPAPKQ
jgi:hypothetical protein